MARPRSIVEEVLPPLIVSVVIHLLAYFIVDWVKPVCGDSVVASSEECDDGNLRPDDGCTPMCEIEPICGDGKIEGDEKCDDGNTLDGDGCSSQCELLLDLREVELPPESEPEPEPEPIPEPEPEIEVEPPPEPPPEAPPPPPKKVKPRAPKPSKPSDPAPADAPPAPAIELPMDTVIKGSNSGVTVIGGDKSRPGVAGGSRDGVKGGRPGGKGTVKDGKGTAPTGPAKGAGKSWAPKSELYIAQLPRALKQIKLECPAARDLGISGTVVLKVQIRSNGTVRSAKVIKGIGNGCDEIAQKALRKTKFKAAVGTDGKKTDFEIARYEYVYKASR